MEIEIPQILVIDDDPETRDQIARALDDDGFEVRQAENGRRGLFLLTGFRPLLIVLDMMMPEMNGIEFCKELRQHEVNDIPVLALSPASPKSRMMREFFDLPLIGKGFLKEPFEPVDLVHKVLEMVASAEEGIPYSDAPADLAGDQEEKPIRLRERAPEPEPEPEPAPASARPSTPDPESIKAMNEPTASLSVGEAPPSAPEKKSEKAKDKPPAPPAQGRDTPAAKARIKKKSANAPAATPPPASPPQEASKSEAAPASGGPRLRILMVDDEPDILLVLKDSLGRRHEVATANNGMEAVALLDEFQPEFVLCDISMPVMNGFQTVEAIRHHPICFNTPVFFLSGERDSKLPRLSFEAGGNLFLNKPISGERLLKLIDRFVDDFSIQPRPLTAPPKSEGAEGKPGPGAGAPTARPKGAIQRTHLRILTVDDTPATMAAMRKVLESTAEAEGWELLYSEDPREALANLARWEPDLILYNPRCRKLDGIAFTQTLKLKKIAGFEIAFFAKEFYEADVDFSHRVFGREAIRMDWDEHEILNALLGVTGVAEGKARPKKHAFKEICDQETARHDQMKRHLRQEDMQRETFRNRFKKMQQFIDDESKD